MNTINNILGGEKLMSFRSEDGRCSQCPFSRSTSKEYLDTMGDNGERFAGQARGPFTLPCHMTKEFKEWQVNPIEGQTPCAGAAIYRTNCGYTDLPPSIPLLPENKEEVFASPAELIAHHKGVPVAMAAWYLTQVPVELMTIEELGRADNKCIPVKNEH